MAEFSPETLNPVPCEALTQYVRSVESRIIGRVFTWDDRMHFVVQVDEDSGLARVNCKGRSGVDTFLMPVGEVVFRLAQEQQQWLEPDCGDDDEDLDVDF